MKAEMLIERLNKYANYYANRQELFYDTEEAINFISNQTGVEPNIVAKVLDADVDFMSQLGIIENQDFTDIGADCKVAAEMIATLRASKRTHKRKRQRLSKKNKELSRQIKKLTEELDNIKRH
jgi:hypothetical protein